MEKITMKNFAKSYAWFLLLAGLISLQSLFSQQKNNYSEEIRLFRDFVKKEMDVEKIPGLSIAFMKDDFVWAEGFGYSDLENKTPTTAKSGYRLASNTKSMTAVAILQLVEKGKINLDDEVQKYVPYFPRKRWPVTIRELLGHLGGISHYKNYDIEGHIKEHKDTRDAVAIFAGFDLIAEPGTKFNYSSYGYDLLGAVIEGASKEPYGDYVREHIWLPLGMNNTYMDDPDSILPGRVRGYRLIDGKIKNSEFVDVSSRFAAGGTRSTVCDLLKYAKGLNSGELLSKKSVDLMYTSMATKDGRFTDYGMGWRVVPVNGRFRVYHTGGQPETRTLLVMFPEENFAIALAYNLEGGNLHAFSHRLFQLIFDEQWNMKTYMPYRIDDAVYAGLQDVFNYGLSYFERHKKPLTNNPEELRKAFDYFNIWVTPDSLEKNFKRAFKKIQDGRHPIAGEAFVKIGSYMTAKLLERFGSQRIELYHKMGAIRFFDDYIKMSDSLPGYQAGFRFSQSLEKKVSQWNLYWNKTYTDYIRRLSITPYSNLEEIGNKLKKIFSGAKIYPDFTDSFTSITRYFYINNHPEKAINTAKIAIGLYPKSPSPYVFLANAYICNSEEKKAMQFYKKALKINPDAEPINSKSLNRYAVDLMNYGKLDEAMRMLKVAVKLYPEEPRFYHTIGEIYVKLGKKYYKKALKVDPTFEPPRNRLKRLW